MESLLQGRLRNTHLPYNKGLIPLFEAVVNSIQSIEELNEGKDKPLSDYSIGVEIIRDTQQVPLIKEDKRESNSIESFRITDNGIGFTENNWNSFSTLDSLWKVQKGCRGIGRLMWLKAFKRVEIDSSYLEGKDAKRRKFSFDAQHDVSDPDPSLQGITPTSTTVLLDGFDSKFAASVHKTLETISTGLLEHCLWYFVREQGVPTINISDGADTTDLFELFGEHKHSSAMSETVTIKDHEFEVTHVKFRPSKSKPHNLSYCAAGRLVKEEPIQNKIPSLSSTISDESGEFTYAAYITSSFLDERVFEQRIGFNIDDEVEGLFERTDVSFKDIRDAVLPKIRNFLGASLDENIKASKERVDEFVAKVAPRYRPMLNHIPEEQLAVDPNISDKDLDMALHRQVFQVEQQLLKDGHKIMVPEDGESEAAYATRLEEYLQTAADLKQSDLANYVMHRRVVIDLLESAINSDGDGSYAREDVIHKLIVPMRTTSDSFEFSRQSLWLLDERLAFHNFLASDIPLTSQPIISNSTTKKPDVSCLRVYDNPLLVADTGHAQQASLTVVEIKKPMRTGYKPLESEEKDPILQALNYLKRLREGAQTKNGRSIPNADQIPGFVYVLADLTNHLIECCDLWQLQKTADGMGYFGYHPNTKYNAYIQVISFDGLLASAKERNRAFLDTLGLPSK